MRLLLILPIFLFSSPAFSQIISDKQVGRTLGQVLCGEKNMNTAVNYLNNMQVPTEKMTNVTDYPDIVNEVNKARRRCN